MRRAAFLAGLLLAACGPVSPERAADICEDRARSAAGPTGEIGVGVNSRDGLRSSVELEITSDYILGRDPYMVYEQCVRNMSGQGPIRPLVLE